MMEDYKIMVDIIIPTHNGVEKLKKALGSIVA